MSNDKYNTGPDDLVTRFAALEARVSLLETVPNLGSATIDTGTLRIKDNTGSVRVELGLLSDGTYGLNVKENQQNIFHQVPYVYASAITTGEATSSTTYTDLATLGPSVTVPVGSTGRILVIATAQVQSFTGAAGANTVDGRFDVAFSGTNTRNPDETVDPLVGISNITVNMGGANTDAIGEAISTTTQAVFETLNTGLTTITMKYRKGAGATADPTFFRRVLTVVRL